MDNKAEKVSMIMPVYNGERFIADALQSVVQQQEPPDEIIVVDDGSTDGSARIAGQFSGVRVVHQKHSGLPAARNRGLAEATGNLISIFDSDDIQLDGCLATLKRTLLQDKAIDAAVGRIQLVSSAQLQDDGSYEIEALSESFHSFMFGAVLLRAKVFEKVGSFDETSSFCDDLDWLMRAREAGCKISFIDENVLYYRRHGDNLTNDREQNMQGMLRVLRASLGRRNAGDGGENGDLPRMGIDNRPQPKKGKSIRNE